MNNYKERLRLAIESHDRAKIDIAYYKLQIKQVKVAQAWSKKSAIVKAALKAIPELRIEHGPNLTYLSVTVPCTDQRDMPEGWEGFEWTKDFPDSIGSPTTTKYKYPGQPVIAYITRRVY